MKKILITGGAGFVGFHMAKHPEILKSGQIVVIDNINDYYDPTLKVARLKELGISINTECPDFEQVTSTKHPNLSFYRISLENYCQLDDLYKTFQFDKVVHLAAQAGVRYSIENPQAYIDSNIQGFLNLLECCRKYPVEHLLYASSSSVYGDSLEIPFKEDANVDHPVSFYAATKKSNELMASCYSHLYKVPSTGLRFFTVYGPWGRPDMAYFSFTEKILEGGTIQVFNNGNMKRDFTYIDDICESISRLVDKPPHGSESERSHRILNIGHGSPVDLLSFIETLEISLNKTVKKEYKPMQQGDVHMTYADTSKLQELIQFIPQVSIADGIQKFIEWYRSFYL